MRDKKEFENLVNDNRILFWRFNDEIVMNVGNGQVLWFQRNGHHVYLTAEAFLEEAQRLDTRRV